MRKYGTCFFEQYAQISLSALLGSEYDALVGRDRPDLQTPDHKTLGIEVTRAMEQSKAAATQMLKDIAGLPPEDTPAEDLDRILESGYSFGLREADDYVGRNELDYWAMAQPLRRILRSKVAKAGNGFYGHFDRMGLYVFCKDPLDDWHAGSACRLVSELQAGQEIRYDRLYLSDVDGLYVCSLPAQKMERHSVSSEQRRSFYLEAVRLQLEAGR